MYLYGILKFSSTERVNTHGVTFCIYPHTQEIEKVRIVSTKVRCNVDRWCKVCETDEGKYNLIELYGPVGNKQSESLVMQWVFGILPCKYPDVIPRNEVNEVNEDLVSVIDVFSVDDKNTQDRDDAMSIIKNEDGTIICGIHITDVSTQLRESVQNMDDMLNFSMHRASTAYTSSKSIPMFPDILAHGELSLSPNEERKTITLWLKYNNDHSLMGHEFRT